jgi:hypothetical protein
LYALCQVSDALRDRWQRTVPCVGAKLAAAGEPP